jgi:carboxypeptidase Q
MIRTQTQRALYLVLPFALLSGATLAQQTPTATDDVVARIKDEGLNRSQVMQTLSYLSDVIGPRLTCSPNMLRANEWTRAKLTEWGLSNAHLETWGPFGRGWSLERFSAQVVAPQSIPLIAYPKAWSPGLKGNYVGEVVYLDATTEADLAKYKGKLKGAIVLTAPIRDVKAHFEPQGERFTDEQLKAMEDATPRQRGGRQRPPGAPGGPGGAPGGAPGQFRGGPRGNMAFAGRKLQFAMQEGTALVVEPSPRGDDGTVFVQSATVPQPMPAGGPPGGLPPGGGPGASGPPAGLPPGGGPPAGGPPPDAAAPPASGAPAGAPPTGAPAGRRGGAGAPGFRRVSPWDKNAPKIVPQVVVAVEQYNRMIRMLQAGEKLKMAVELSVKFYDGDYMGRNTVAEIPGSDLKDQLVMLGGHMDSWHAGTGATDNGAGVAVAMEAVRILRALHLQPRRTIRVALWSGEEEGLLGSRAYVAEHFASRSTPSFGGGPGGPGPGAPGDLTKKAEYEKLSGYFNLDNGTGKIRGVYLQGNAAVGPIFGEWLTPFKDMGAATITINNTGGTDHQSFDGVGLPGFQFIQDTIEYDTRTHHSNEDVFDRVQGDDLKQAAVIMATFVYNTAVRDEMLPRKVETPATN